MAMILRYLFTLPSYHQAIVAESQCALVFQSYQLLFFFYFI
jgi:hypothetical protein